ncbi:hypothetical protein [Photobacterium lipolyticum]|nr:hypothetical protein [Photobacterium lipolyticum]
MSDAFNILNQEYEKCDATKKVISSVSNNWFNSLSIEDKKSVLPIVDYMAMRRCTKDADAEYSLVLVDYAAETGDFKPLEAWVGLIGINKSMHESIMRLGMSNLLELSKSEEFLKPIMLMETAEQLDLLP